MGRRSLTPTNVPDQDTAHNELDQEYPRYTEMDGGYYSMNSDLTDTRYPTYHHYSDNNPNACFWLSIGDTFNMDSMGCYK